MYAWVLEWASYTSLVSPFWQATFVVVELWRSVLLPPVAVQVSPPYLQCQFFVYPDAYLGSVIFPAILYQLQPTVGLAWATRTIALIILVTLLLMLAIVRRRVVPVPSERRQLFDKTALRDVPYMLFTAALTLAFMGLYVPFFFISPYMSARSSASTALARYMVPILNAASIPGAYTQNST